MKRVFFTRRQMLYGSLGMAAAMTSVASRCQSSLLDGGVDFSNSLAQAAREDVSKAAPLKERAKGKGLLYGAATMWGVLESDAAFADVIKRECDILTAENELKWDTLRPSPMSFNFDWGDRLVEFNRQNNILTRGHTLVWHWVPGWFRETVNQQNAELFLVEHITKVVGRYAGQIHSWDVVNEAIAPEEGRSDGLRQSPWLEFLGEDYIEIAFHAAAAADPSALLVYNDYGLEYDTFNDDKKRAAVLKLLERLRSKNVPIHAFGMQSHLYGHVTEFNPTRLRTFLSDVASLDLKILLTELDVNDKRLPADILVRDQIAARAYSDYLNVALDEPAVISVQTWGLSDRYTWLTQFAARDDGLPVRPLPLDENLERKLAWQAIAAAFDQAPVR